MFSTTKRLVVKASSSGRELVAANYNFGFPAVAGGSGMGIPSGGNMSVSAIGAGLLNNLDTMMSGIIPEDEQSLRRYYRDIYNYDVMAGSAVDLMSTLPFSDFTLSGAEPEVLNKYMSNIEHLNLKTLMPDISVEYLSLGSFTGTLLYDRERRRFSDIIPHNPDHLTTKEVPMYGADPMLVLKVSDEMRRFLRSTEPYMAEVRKRMPASMINTMLENGNVVLDSLTTLHIPRRTSPRGNGVSIYKRIVPLYLLEKILYRGTITEATKRQRATMHVKMGSEYWEPTDADLQMITALFQQADLDPLGAIIATRMDVDVNEIRNGGDFWKYTDITDLTGPMKQKALGISDAFLSGEANWNTADSALSVFLEQIRAYRDMLTRKIFYDKLFPTIAVVNGYREKESLSKAEVRAYEDTSQDLDGDGKKDGVSFMNRHRNREGLIIPELHWHKQLRPEADREYLDVLNTMAEKGVPVTIRAWAAAGGIDIDRTLEGLEDDVKLRNKIRKVTEGLVGGGTEGSDFEEDASQASLQKVLRSLETAGINRKNLMSRDFGEHAEISTTTKTGKKKHVIGQSAANKKANELIAGSLKRLSDANHFDAVVKATKKKKVKNG